MIEREWLTSEDPAAVLCLLWDRNRGSNRRFLLFAVGYVRLERPRPESLKANLDLWDRFVDGHVPAEEFAAVMGYRPTTEGYLFLEAFLSRLRRKERDPEVNEKNLVAAFGCVFGDPRRPLPMIPQSALTWNDGTVRKMAQVIYDDRAFGRLPLLADALEDAGCTDADILSHCRGPGPHVRGCWVVDALLGKN